MLLFMDGMAHYDTARIGMKYSTLGASRTTWAITAEGRFGNCVKKSATSGGPPTGYLQIAPLMTRQAVWAPSAGGVCGFAIKVDDLAAVSGEGGQIGGDTTQGFFVVVEGGSEHVKAWLNPNGTFSVFRNSGNPSAPVLLAESTEGLASNTWMYVEFKWVLHNSAGSFAIRVNGVTVLSVSGVDTLKDPLAGSTLGVWNVVSLLGVQSTTPPLLTMRMCDLYLADLVSVDPDDVSDFLGDGVVHTIMPNGVGSAADWTPSVGANWDTVNDRPAPDDDATYVRADTIGQTDVHQFEDIPPGAIVKGVHLLAMARKETEGASAIAPIVHQGSTDYQGPTQGVAAMAYDRYLTQPYDLNPATGDKFTAAEVNAGQFGFVKTI